MTGDFDSNTVLAIARRYRAMPTNRTLDELAAAILSEDASPSLRTQSQSDSTSSILGDGSNDRAIASLQNSLKGEKDAKVRSGILQQIRALRGRGELFDAADRRNRP